MSLVQRTAGFGHDSRLTQQFPPPDHSPSLQSVPPRVQRTFAHVAAAPSARRGVFTGRRQDRRTEGWERGGGEVKEGAATLPRLLRGLGERCDAELP